MTVIQERQGGGPRPWEGLRFPYVTTNALNTQKIGEKEWKTE